MRQSMYWKVIEKQYSSGYLSFFIFILFSIT